MDFSHRMLRTMVSGVVNKALREIPCDPKRTLRSLADLGAGCARGAAQKAFFARMESALASPASPYYPLANHLIEQVSPETLRAFGVNLGASSLTWGVGQLRRCEKESDHPLPWLLLIEGAASPPVSLIREANAFGCYTFILRGLSPVDACELALAASESAFFAEFSADQISSSAVPELEKAANLAVSLKADGWSDSGQAFAALRGARRLFGFTATVTEETFDPLTGEEFLDRMVRDGCLYGCYRCAGDDALAARLHKLVDSARGAQKGRPLLLFDLVPDSRFVAEVISAACRAVRIDSLLPLVPQLVSENFL